MDFTHNKYHKWYFSLCLRGQNRPQMLSYSERHHIIPKSCGGSNKKENITVLTAREHFVAHLCLVRCTHGVVRQKMLAALLAFRRQNKLQKAEYGSIRFTSRHFDAARREAAQIHGIRLRNNPTWKANVAVANREKNKRQDVQDKKRISNRASTSSLWQNEQYRAKVMARIHTRNTAEYRKTMSEAKRKNNSPEKRKRLSDAARARWSNPEYRQRRSLTKKGTHSDPE